VLGRALTDPIWWFYVFWLPQYLSEARGFSLKKIAIFVWVPFAAADIGNFTGGFISGYCIRRGVPVIHAPVGVCLQLPSDAVGHSGCERTQSVCCAGADQPGGVGISSLVYDGTYIAV
jgi:hypothetical protein